VHAPELSRWKERRKKNKGGSEKTVGGEEVEPDNSILDAKVKSGGEWGELSRKREVNDHPHGATKASCADKDRHT